MPARDSCSHTLRRELRLHEAALEGVDLGRDRHVEELVANLHGHAAKERLVHDGRDGHGLAAGLGGEAVLDLLELLDAFVVLADVDVTEGFESDGLLVQFYEHLSYLLKLLILGLGTDLLLDAGDLSLQVLNMLQIELDHLLLVRALDLLATLLDLQEAGIESLMLLHKLIVDLLVQRILALVAGVQNLL